MQLYTCFFEILKMQSINEAIHVQPEWCELDKAKNMNSTHHMTHVLWQCKNGRMLIENDQIRASFSPITGWRKEQKLSARQLELDLQYEKP